MTISIRIDRREELVRKLDVHSLMGQAWKRALRETRTYADQIMHIRSPKGRTGKLDAAIRSFMDSAEFPLFAGVEIKNMPTAGKKNIRYGGVLEGSKKRQFKYRKGPKAGELTKGWWSGARKMIWAYFRKHLRDVEASMEREFNRDKGMDWDVRE